MAVRKIKSSWWADIRASHTRYRKRSPENSRTGALAYEAALRQKLARGDSIDGTPEGTHQDQAFESFAWTWFNEYVVLNNRYSEQVAKKYILASSVIPFFAKMPIGQIASYHIERYKAQLLKQGMAGKTIKNRLTVLNKCLITAYEWLELRTKPPKITWPKCASYRTDYLSHAECELLLSSEEGVLHEMILTALRTGMRLGELKGLQWSSLDWENRSVWVRHSRCEYSKVLVPPKNNRERYIPLDIDLYGIFHRRRKSTGYVFTDEDGQAFTGHCLNRRLAGICKKAGLRKITWHVLRHTFASHLAMRGVPLSAVQVLLGHSHIGTTMRYAHLARSTLRTAIDMLNPKRMLDADFGQPVGNQWLQTQRNEIAQNSGTPESVQFSS